MESPNTVKEEMTNIKNLVKDIEEYMELHGIDDTLIAHTKLLAHRQQSLMKAMKNQKHN